MPFEAGKDLGQANSKPDSNSNDYGSDPGESSNRTRGNTAAHVDACDSGL